MTIQRYTGENVEFHATGGLVAYEDYAELKEEYERLDESHSAALAKIDALELWASQAVELWDAGCDLDGHMRDMPIGKSEVQS